MALPAPNLDDRRFQDLVDDAKRLVQQHCPEWTDHNVSDPGVTLIETFAFMVDQLLYRLNRVPDRTYVKFLELIGLRLLPPAAARSAVTFWLSAAQTETLPVPQGTAVATRRTDATEPVVYTTIEDLAIVPCSVQHTASSVEEAKFRSHTDALRDGRQFSCFDATPKPGDSLYVGLSDPVPSCAVALRFDCQIEGVGVDPLDPPLAWEAWGGSDWLACDVDHDDTGGLNRAGDVVLHVPKAHAASVIDRRRAGWLRCRVIEPREGQPFYSHSPSITALTAFTIGGTADAVHAAAIEDEILGLSEGVAGQKFALAGRPVVPSEVPLVVEVATGAGWQAWTRVDNFAESSADDPHFMLDEVDGEVLLGPAVMEADGVLRQYGAVPPKGAPLRVPAYRTGGGRSGNVAAGAVTILKTSIPYITRVENRYPASGGVDAESVESAKLRGPILLRTRNRAVTAEDYEVLARMAAPEVGRVRCVPAGSGIEAGAARLLVVPAAADGALGTLAFESLVPAEETLAAIAAYLDERRTLGARVIVEPPAYQGVTVVARIRPHPRASASRVQADALAALYSYFHPLRGGPDGDGWPFGRPVHVGEVYGILQRVDGAELVEDARLFAADPLTHERGSASTRIDIDPNSLVFSYEHQVLVQSGDA